MGVIHKLSEDVTSFIISHKKNNPTIGVRQLSLLTSEKFKIKVSKSSVNSVLKNASLSSGVGRRALNDKKDKKFSIPTAKKEEISKNFQKLGFTKSEKPPIEEKASKPKEEVQDNISIPLMPDPVEQEHYDQGVEDEPIKVDVNQTRANQDFLNHVKQVREQNATQKGKELKGMGFAFLKAAEWEISSKSTMAELFRKQYPKEQEPGIFDVACELFLFFKFLGTETIEDISSYREHGLWPLNNHFDKTLDEDQVLSKTKEMLEWFKQIDETGTSNMAMEYNLQRAQIFSQVSHFQLILENETKINIDPHFLTLGGKVTQAQNQTLPTDKALSWLSHYLISNNTSLVYQAIAGETQFDQGFFELVGVYENFLKKKIEKIIVCDDSKEPLAEFSTIPNNRRTFLAGVSPQQKEFALFTENVKWAAKKPFYHQETDKVVYFAETKSNSLEKQFEEKINDFRVITLWREEEKEPFWVILCNQEKGSSEEIIRVYISRWPYFNEYQKNKEKLRSSEHIKQESNFVSFEDIFSDYIGALNQHCQRAFFPPNYSENDVNQMIQIVYDSSGYFTSTENTFRVNLIIPESSEHRKNLEYATRRVNQAHILDLSGRKLWLNIC